MGGYGSGWKWGRKLQVEECLILSAARLQSAGVLRPHFVGEKRLNWYDGYGQDFGGGTWTLKVQTGESDGRIAFVPPGRSWPIHSADLTTTPLPWGGARWWFLCPAAKHREGWRKGTLYLKPGTDLFACRACHDLTYWTRQTNNRPERLDRWALRTIRSLGR